MLILRVVCDNYNIRNGAITIACDNDSSLDKCVATKYRANVTDRYFDLLWATYDLRQHLRVKCIPKIVAGHQEGKKKKLNLYERLNVECDLRSKAFRRKIEEGAIRHKPKSFGFEQWHVTLFGIRVNYDFEKQY